MRLSSGASGLLDGKPSHRYEPKEMLVLQMKTDVDLAGVRLRELRKMLEDRNLRVSAVAAYSVNSCGIPGGATRQTWQGALRMT